MPTVTTTVTSAAASGVTTTVTTTEATPEAIAPLPSAGMSVLEAGGGKMTVAYWKIRGLAQAIRVLCEYCDIEFENKMYAQDVCPRPIPEKMCAGHPFPSMEAYEESKKCWFDVKGTAMGDYHSPNLPYLIDGGVRLSESNAILRYIGKKATAKGGQYSTICGGTPQEVANNEFMIDKAMDLRNKLIKIGYATTFPSFFGGLDKIMEGDGTVASKYYQDQADAYVAALPTDLALFEKYMGGGLYFAGNNVTVCDFHMFELLDQQRAMFGIEIYEGFPKIKAYMERFGADPKIVAAYKKYNLPANNEMSWTTVAGIC